MTSPSGRTLVVGIGNPWRGDDRVGLEIAAAMRALDLDGVDVLCVADDLLEMLDVWHGYAQVVLVDAVKSDSPAGTVHRIELSAGAWPVGVDASVSTHAVPLTTAIELAHRLGRLPRRLVLIGVEAESITTGQGLSPAVHASMPTAVADVRALCSVRQGT
jgi:hydrogenase maturation protease